MRCREAQQRIADIGEAGFRTDSELAKHLSQCPACAALAAAEERLAESIAAVRTADEADVTSFAVIRSQLQAQSVSQLEKERTVMSAIRSMIVSHPKASMGLVLAVAAFLFVTLVPFSYHKVVGYEVTFSRVDEGAAVNLGRVVDGLHAIGYDNVNVSQNITGKSLALTLSGLPTYGAAREAAVAFNSITGNTGEGEIAPVTQEVSGSLYAQVAENLFTVEIQIDTEGKTDAEIEADIIARLTAAGFDNVEVTTTTLPNGEKEIQIEMSSEN